MDGERKEKPQGPNSKKEAKKPKEVPEGAAEVPPREVEGTKDPGNAIIYSESPKPEKTQDAETGAKTPKPTVGEFTKQMAADVPPPKESLGGYIKGLATSVPPLEESVRERHGDESKVEQVGLDVVAQNILNDIIGLKEDPVALYRKYAHLRDADEQTFLREGGVLVDRKVGEMPEKIPDEVHDFVQQSMKGIREAERYTRSTVGRNNTKAGYRTSNWSFVNIAGLVLAASTLGVVATGLYHDRERSAIKRERIQFELNLGDFVRQMREANAAKTAAEQELDNYKQNVQAAGERAMAAENERDSYKAAVEAKKVLMEQARKEYETQIRGLEDEIKKQRTWREQATAEMERKDEKAEEAGALLKKARTEWDEYKAQARAQLKQVTAERDGLKERLTKYAKTQDAAAQPPEAYPTQKKAEEQEYQTPQAQPAQTDSLQTVVNNILAEGTPITDFESKVNDAQEHIPKFTNAYQQIAYDTIMAELEINAKSVRTPTVTDKIRDLYKELEGLIPEQQKDAVMEKVHIQMGSWMSKYAGQPQK